MKGDQPVCHALIIEDEPFVAMMVEDALLTLGVVSIDVAITELEAIAHARLRRPDVITSDVRLLEGRGPLAVAAIREEHGAVPVVFITATPAECEPCSYAESILAKPVDANTVKRAIRPLLARISH